MMSKRKNITPNQRIQIVKKLELFRRAIQRSPDLNPIEHLRNDTEKEVQKQKPSNIKALENIGYPSNY
uniref:HRDC domain-containing protein n=1 Tax=Heterorhabditis bacteriophora TaxID=37862 RepID=A0A1I7WZJ2_HETBA